MIRILTLGIVAAAVLALGIAIGVQYRVTASEPNSSSDPTGLQPTYRAGPFNLGVEVIPETPAVGENHLRVRLEDREGEPVRGASIRAVAEMPAMGTMPAMQAPADMREIEPGVYQGTFDLSMEGSWPLTLAIRADAGEARVTLDMATGRKGLHLSSGGTLLNEGSSGTQSLRDSGGDSLPYRSGPYRFAAKVQPQTPRVGDNALILQLRNEAGDPISQADIRAVAEMPAMGTMPAMQAPAEMNEVKPGLYRGTFDLSMEGSWPLTLSIEAPGLPERRITFDLATGRPDLSLASGAVRSDGGTEVEEAPPGTVTLDPSRRQLIGVKTAAAQVVDLERTIRAVGKVTYDETRLADVTLKFDAWVGELFVDYVGATVQKGEPLFTVYGPELLAAQQEYLELTGRAGRGGISKDLVAAARKRISLWGMTAKQISRLERRGSPSDYVAIPAPISGTVVTKNVVEGTAHQAGATLMRIADLSQVWVEADIYEAELPLVRAGMPVEVRLPYMPAQKYQGEVEYVYPYLEAETRTGRVRITLANQEGVLKPDMYAEVKLKADLGKRLTVPEEAVIVSGETRVVFEDLGGGRLAPRVVETGQRADGRIEILSGLEPDDRVVTSGNFLIASESRLKAGIKQW